MMSGRSRATTAVGVVERAAPLPAVAAAAVVIAFARQGAAPSCQGYLGAMLLAMAVVVVLELGEPDSELLDLVLSLSELVTEVSNPRIFTLGLLGLSLRHSRSQIEAACCSTVCDRGRGSLRKTMSAMTQQSKVEAMRGMRPFDDVSTGGMLSYHGEL